MQQSSPFQMMAPGAVVKKIMIVNVFVWIVFQIIIQNFLLPTPYVTIYFSLIPKMVIESFFLWQFVTYMFLHAMNPMHILFNMLSLWFFGSELEVRWGSKLFLTYYLVCGAGAGLFYVFGISVYGLIKGAEPAAYMDPVIGASGAVFGVLLAYGVLFGERFIYFFGAFPIKAKYFVLILGVFELVNLLSTGFSGAVANLAHLGGIVTGAIFLLGWTRFQQSRFKGGSSRRKLKLVVNRDNKTDNGPRYWN
jgi:membrane associated rhomboid family serine protease